MDLHIFHPKKITERILWTYQKELCHKCISETWPMFGRQLRKSAPVVACRWDHGDSHDRGDHHDHHDYHGDDHDMY